MMPRRTAPAGLTLIEVLFAIAILGMIAGLVYSSFLPTMELMQQVNEGRGFQRRTRLTFQRMETEFRSAFLGNFDASNKRFCELDLRDCPYFFVGENNGEFDEVTFTTLAGRPTTRRIQSDQLWLHYYVEKDIEASKDSPEPVMALWREERPIHGGDFDDTVPEKRVLFSHVSRFNLRYVERGTTNDFLDDWDSTRGLDETETNNLPRAVEISIKYSDERGQEGEALTIVELPFSVELKEEEKR